MAAGGVAPPPPPYFRATTTDTALWLRRFDIQNTWEYLLALLVLFLLAALREVIGGAHRRLAASSRTRPGGALIARYSVEHQSAAPGGGIDHEALDREMLLGRQSMVRRFVSDPQPLRTGSVAWKNERALPPEWTLHHSAGLLHA